MNKNIIIILAVLVVLVVGYLTWTNYSAAPGEVACTMEAKLCPDGSAVGRSGPKCEFAACPPVTNMETNTQSSTIQVTPIEHASLVLKWGERIIYADPVGTALFAGQPVPDLILITDIHGDHLDLPALQAISKTETIIVAPKAVADKLPKTLLGTVVVVNNGATISQKGISIEAIPMYNLPEKADAYHIKGRGNGYVLEAGGKRVYISGDTSAIPEMKNLKNIDMAFVCMNLPYTMTVEEAAGGVLAFKPKQVYPYHYKGTSGLSDVNKFKQLVNAGDPKIEVTLLNWYPN